MVQRRDIPDWLLSRCAEQPPEKINVLNLETQIASVFQEQCLSYYIPNKVSNKYLLHNQSCSN